MYTDFELITSNYCQKSTKNKNSIAPYYCKILEKTGEWCSSPVHSYLLTNPTNLQTNLQTTYFFIKPRLWRLVWYIWTHPSIIIIHHFVYFLMTKYRNTVPAECSSGFKATSALHLEKNSSTVCLFSSVDRLLLSPDIKIESLKALIWEMSFSAYKSFGIGLGYAKNEWEYKIIFFWI